MLASKNCGSFVRIARIFRAFNNVGPNIVKFRVFSSLPPHQIVNMPALSPTMSSGTIGKWVCKVGDKVSPGDALAEVETDKATVTFECQDDFVIAKFLVEAGNEVKVGDPILVTVEDASTVSAFANFVLASAPAKPAAPAPTVAPAAPKPAAPPAAAVAAPAPPKQAPTPATAPAAQPAAAPKPATASAKPAAATATKSVPFGTLVINSALASKMASDQQTFIDKYGRTGHQPLPVPKDAKK